MPLAVRMELLNEVIRLRETEALTYSQIIRVIERTRGLVLSKSTISYWVTRKHSPLGRIQRFDAKPSPELAYIIGVIAGDGSLNVYKNTYRVRLQAVDLDFVREFDKCLCVVLGARPHNIWRGAGRREYHVDVSSFQLHQFLMTRAVDLSAFVEYDARCVSSFLRGFFDSEGSVSKVGDLTVSNSDRSLLMYVQELLSRYFEIETSGPYLGTRKGTEIVRRGKRYIRTRDCYVVRVRRKCVLKFSEEVGLTSARKVLRLTLLKTDKVTVGVQNS